MYQVVIQWLAQAVSRATPVAINAASSALSKHIGKPVAASAAAIIESIKGFAAGNSTTALVVGTILAQAGIELAIEKITSDTKVGSDPTAMRLISEISRFQQQIKSQRSTLTGDGKEDTIHGRKTADVDSDIARLVVTNEIISKASRIVGGTVALRAIREAIFLEDADFDNFTALRG